jgi:hypothetical protein
MSPRNTCRIVEGRLLEIDVAAGYERVSDVDEMIAMIKSATAAVAEPTRMVIAADWRMCRLFSEAVATRAVEMLTATSGRIERSAILHRSDHGTSVLQVFRLVKEAQQTHRELFTQVDEMEAWLGEVLNDAERQRLHAFLTARPPGPNRRPSSP